MTRISDLQLKFELYQLHKSMGVTVLGLMILRVFWRLAAKPPALPPHMARWERVAAQKTHVLLYVLIARDAADGLGDGFGRTAAIQLPDPALYAHSVAAYPLHRTTDAGPEKNG